MAVPIQQRQAIIITPVSVTNGATVTGTVDCKGYDFITIDATLGTSDDATNNPSTFKIQESDDNTASWTDVTALVGDGTGGFTIPAAVTAGTHGYKFNIDMRPLKRYLKLLVTPLTTQIIGAVGNLSAGDGASNTTSANVAVLVEA